MQMLSDADSSKMKDIVSEQPPTKVCMHVLNEVRTDPRVLREATALIEAGFMVSIVDVEDKAIRPGKEEIAGISVKHILMSSSFISTRRWSFFKAAQIIILGIFQLIQIEADIYHAHNETALPACYIAACLRRKPLIFDAHELPLFYVPLSEMGMYRRWFHKLLALFLNKVVPCCAGIIPVSPPIAQEIRNIYHTSEVSLIRNVPTHQLISGSDRLRQHLRLSQNVHIALYQGNLELCRGLDKLVRAAPFLGPDIVIVLMGQDDGTTKAQLETLIATEGVGDRVKILPPVPYEELLDWTASADIGLTVLSPDYSQHIRLFLPNKLFEYLRADVPVLSSQLDAITDVIKMYDVGMVVPSLAPKDIGGAIKAMLADHDGLARMSSNALAAAKQELNWEKESSQLVRLYHDILGCESHNVRNRTEFSPRIPLSD